MTNNNNQHYRNNMTEQTWVEHSNTTGVQQQGERQVSTYCTWRAARAMH